MDQNPRPEVYQLHVWIRQISLMIWRRFLIRSDSTLTDLHNTLQIAFGWSDFHLHRFRLQQVAERIESELGEEQPHFIDERQRDWNQLPALGPPPIVGLDGGYVHAKDQKSRTEGWFEVIVGKSAPAEDEAKCLAIVSKYDTKPKRRLFVSFGRMASAQVLVLPTPFCRKDTHNFFSSSCLNRGINHRR